MSGHVWELLYAEFNSEIFFVEYLCCGIIINIITFDTNWYFLFILFVTIYIVSNIQHNRTPEQRKMLIKIVPKVKWNQYSIYIWELAAGATCICMLI